MSLFVLYLTFCTAADRCATITKGEPVPQSLCEQEAKKMAREYELREAECREIKVSI